MPRKKVSTDAEVIEGIAELDDDEQFVEETTRKVRRERRPRQPKPENAPPVIEIPDDDDDEPAETPPFSQTSLAARLFSEDESDQILNQYCTVNIRRNPDSMNDHFVTPNGAILNLPPLRNISIASEQSEIEELIRRDYGGGHYFFQLHFNGALGPSWKSSLSDLPQHLRHRPGETAADHRPTTEPPPPAAPQRDPMDLMLDNLTRMKQLRDALFGDERERLEREIEQMRREIENRPEPAPPRELPENLQILEKALATSNPTLQEKLLDYAFPPAESSHWIPDTLKLFFEHKEEIGGILGGLLSSFLPQPPQPTPQGIEAILRTQPPTGIPVVPTTVQPSQFRPKQIAQTDDEHTDNEHAASELSETTHIESEETKDGDSKLD